MDITIDDVVRDIKEKQRREFIEERPRLYIDDSKERQRWYEDQQRKERESDDSDNNGYIEIQM
jgi:hypothetical protein